MQITTTPSQVVKLSEKLTLAIPGGEPSKFTLRDDCPKLSVILPYVFTTINTKNIVFSLNNAVLKRKFLNFDNHNLKELQEKDIELPVLYGDINTVEEKELTKLEKIVREAIKKYNINTPIYVCSSAGLNLSSSPMQFLVETEDDFFLYETFSTYSNICDNGEIGDLYEEFELSEILNKDATIYLREVDAPIPNTGNNLSKIYKSIVSKRKRKENSIKFKFEKINTLFETTASLFITLIVPVNKTTQSAYFNKMLGKMYKSLNGGFTTKSLDEKLTDIQTRIGMLYMACKSKIISNLSTLGLKTDKLTYTALADVSYHGYAPDLPASIDFTKYEYNDTIINQSINPLEKIILNFPKLTEVATGDDFQDRLLTMHLYAVGILSRLDSNVQLPDVVSIIKRYCSVTSYSKVMYQGIPMHITTLDMAFRDKDTQSILNKCKGIDCNYNSYIPTNKIYVNTNTNNVNITNNLSQLLTSIKTLTASSGSVKNNP